MTGAARVRAAALGAALLAGAGCRHLPPPRHARAALPMPAAVAARYAVPGAVAEDSLVPLGGDAAMQFFRGRLVAGDEVAEFHLVQPSVPARAPLLLLLPVLAGGRDLMFGMASRFAARGYAVAWVERAATALQDGQSGHDLELLFRRTVVHNRMLLVWARSQPAIDVDRAACVGVSMGGIVGGVLLAAEPELRAGALCLAGGDLPRLLATSSYRRVRDWRRVRRTYDGTAGGELVRELSRELVSDPALLGSYVPTAKVLLIGGSLDRVVPPANQDALWESLGRPERRVLPVGHLAAVLVFGGLVDAIDAFLRRRLAAPSDAQEAPAERNAEQRQRDRR